VCRRFESCRGHPELGNASPSIRHRARLSDEELLEHPVLIIGASDTPTSALIGNTLQILLVDERTGRAVGGHRRTVEQAIHRALWMKTPFTAYPFVAPPKTSASET
jgi:cytochrome P450